MTKCSGCVNVDNRDMNMAGRTAFVERLGSIDTRAMIGKFFFDISDLITDYGGEIYRFTGEEPVRDISEPIKIYELRSKW
jgi:hypothetical protein